MEIRIVLVFQCCSWHTWKIKGLSPNGPVLLLVLRSAWSSCLLAPRSSCLSCISFFRFVSSKLANKLFYVHLYWLKSVCHHGIMKWTKYKKNGTSKILFSLKVHQPPFQIHTILHITSRKHPGLVTSLSQDQIGFFKYIMGKLCEFTWSENIPVVHTS